MILLVWILSAIVVPSLCREVVEVAKYGPYGAHRGSGFPPPPRPVPEFLTNATDEVKNMYFDLVGDMKLTIAEKRTSMERISAQNDLLDGYYQWEDQQKNMHSWLSDSVNRIIAQLSSVKAEVDRVMSDDNQTSKLQQKRLFDLNRKYHKEVAVLNFIINQVLTSAPRQGQFTMFSGRKTYGDFDKVAIGGDKLPK